MATIGDKLTAPEAGWRRYDIEKRNNFIFQGQWTHASVSDAYNGNQWNTNQQGSFISFKFYGSKIRIITPVYTNRDPQTSVVIDGVEEFFNQDYGDSRQILIYEKTSLNLGIHEVKIEKIMSGSNYIVLDAVDIDDTGRLLHPLLEEVFDPKDLDIGKVIRCHYTATSNSVGTFSGLGEETGDLIPPASSATPDGDFYFICSGYDFLGRKKLIADRNVQHSISWDSINSVGAVGGLPITFTGLENMNFVTRLMSGGISSTDKDNEWDKIIVESDLGGRITPGDNSIWNWDVLIREWTTSTSTNPAYRVLRGCSVGSADPSGISAWIHVSSAEATATRGFRPLLLIKDLNIPPLLDLSISTSNETAIITGTISDEDSDKVRYKFDVNGEEGVWTDLQSSPVIVNTNISLQIGTNVITVTSEDEKGGVSSKTFTVEVVNEVPYFEGYDIDNYYVYEAETVTLSNVKIKDLEGNKAQYQVQLNGNKIYPEGGNFTLLQDTPMIISPITVGYEDLIDGNNTITILVKDMFGRTISNDYVFKKEQRISPVQKRDVEFPDGYVYNKDIVGIVGNVFTIKDKEVQFVEDTSWSGEGKLYKMSIDLTGVDNAELVKKV